MKSFLPWILVVALLGGVYLLYSAKKADDLQLAKVSADGDEVDKLRADNEELKKHSADSDELARLRKDNEELLKLRGEVQRLRDEKKQLTTQLAAASAQSAQVQQLASENQALRGDSAKLQEVQTTVQQQTDACINNLRIIESVKQQWALEYKKSPIDVPTAADLAPYLTNEISCPAGGAYSINAVGIPATCTIPGHTLQK